MRDTKSKGAVVPAGGEGRPTLLHRRLDTCDFDELAHAFLGWEADFRQIGRGPFRGELDFAQTGGVQVLLRDDADSGP